MQVRVRACGPHTVALYYVRTLGRGRVGKAALCPWSSEV